MPLIETDDIIKQYYQSDTNPYPDIPFEVFEAICKSSFWFFNKSMAREDLPIVHIKYLGKFVVLSTTIKQLLANNNSDFFKKGIITKEQYEFIKAQLKEILRKVLIEEANESNMEVDEG